MRTSEGPLEMEAWICVCTLLPCVGVVSAHVLRSCMRSVAAALAKFGLLPNKRVAPAPKLARLAPQSAFRQIWAVSAEAWDRAKHWPAPDSQSLG